MTIKTHRRLVSIKDPYLIHEYLLDNMDHIIKRRLSKDKQSSVHNLNTGAKEIQHLNPIGPDNSPSSRSHPYHLQWIDKSKKEDKDQESIKSLSWNNQ